MRVATGASVLLVEDDPHIRDLTVQTLEEEGHRVMAVGDGRAALAAAAGCPPDVILLDLTMAGVDGWSFAEAYGRTAPPRAPVVVFTAHALRQGDVEALGAAGVLSKPFDLDELVATVARYVPSMPA